MMHHLSKHSKTYSLLKGVDGSEIKLNKGISFVVICLSRGLSYYLWMKSCGCNLISRPSRTTDMNDSAFVGCLAYWRLKGAKTTRQIQGENIKSKNAQGTTRRRRRLPLLANTASPISANYSAAKTSYTIHYNDDQQDDHYSQIIWTLSLTGH